MCRGGWGIRGSVRSDGGKGASVETYLVTYSVNL